MHRLLAAPFTEFSELDFALHALFVFAGVVVQLFAHRAPELDEFFGEFSFGHVNKKI